MLRKLGSSFSGVRNILVVLTHTDLPPPPLSLSLQELKDRQEQLETWWQMQDTKLQEKQAELLRKEEDLQRKEAQLEKRMMEMTDRGDKEVGRGWSGTKAGETEIRNVLLSRPIIIVVHCNKVELSSSSPAKGPAPQAQALLPPSPHPLALWTCLRGVHPARSKPPAPYRWAVVQQSSLQ